MLLRQIKSVIDQLVLIDKQALSQSSKESPLHAYWLIGAAAVLLLAVHYLKLNSSFRPILAFVSETLYSDPNQLGRMLTTEGWHYLVPLVWWSFVHVIGYLLIPLLLAKYCFKAALSDYGLRWGVTHHHAGWYLLLVTPILFFIYCVSERQDFLSHYPFYRLAHRSWFDFICWELCYILQFIALEFFFRGFMVHGLKRNFGVKAVLVMCLPYLMIHFPKPWLEATGAILFGFFLGLLALLSRSIWGGVMVHLTIAITMDIVALLNTKGLPTEFWPP